MAVRSPHPARASATPAACFAARRAAALASTLALLALAACRAQPQPVGATGLQAEYALGTLRTQLDPRIGVLAVVDAAEIELRARGYAIDDRSASDDAASLSARQSAQDAWSNVRVSARHRAQGTELAVFAAPFGDEVTSRVLMEAIVARLGF